MKTKYKTEEYLAGKTLLDLKEMWETLSPLQGGTAYKYERQHASRAATWLPLAMSETALQTGQLVDEDALHAIRQSIPLEQILYVNPEQMGRKARALFLISVHSISPAVAYDDGPGQELPFNVRKSANNTKESVVRVCRFFQLHFSSRYGMEENGNWPPAAPGRHFSHGMILYRAIQRKHIAEGIFDPADASAKVTSVAAKRYIDRATKRKNAGPFNTMLRVLHEALDEGLLEPLTPALLTDLHPLKFNSWQGERATLSRAEVAKLWPDHFAVISSQPNKLDYTYGLLGFYNKACAGKRPLNPAGEKCPKNNLLGDISIFKRDEAVRRYLYRAIADDGDTDPRPLRDYFAPDRLIRWMSSLLEGKDTITVHHKSEHLDILYVASVYFGITTDEYEEWLEEEGIDFPDAGECLRGPRAVELAGSPTVFLKWADAFGQYAACADVLSESKHSGFYLPRKSCQVDVLIRSESGLRPGNIDKIEVCLASPAHSQALSCPTLWKQSNGSYMLAVPYRCMKQHKKRLSGTGKWKTQQRRYEFVLELDETVQALDEYIEYGWRHAAAVVKGDTRRLFLSREGKPLKTLQGTFQSMRSMAAEKYERSTGTLLPILDRYAARHVIGEFLNRHVPGGQLKTWFLTHRSGIGSDNMYGDDDARFLRSCIHEVLRGMPSKPDQQRQREVEQQQYIEAQSKSLKDLVNQTREQGNRIEHLLNLLEREKEENRTLRGKLAAKQQQ